MFSTSSKLDSRPNEVPCGDGGFDGPPASVLLPECGVPSTRTIIALKDENGVEVTAANMPASSLLFAEYPSFFANNIEPFNETLATPRFLTLDVNGQHKFFKKCICRGHVKVIEVQNGHGAFLLAPNPGYHDARTTALKAVIRKRKTMEDLDAEVCRITREPVTEGFNYCAWWLQEKDVRALKETLARLERDPDCEGQPRDISDFIVELRNDPSGVSSTRDDSYLHNMRALRGRDLPLLRALLSEGVPWLRKIYNNLPPTEAIEVGCHHPYANAFSCFHVHMRTRTYPNSSGGSDRSLYPLTDIISHLEADGNCMSTAVVTGTFNKISSDWFSEMKTSFPTWYQQMRFEAQADGSYKLDVKQKWEASPACILEALENKDKGHVQSINVVAVVGPPGVGKGTSLQPVATALGYYHVSWGDLGRGLNKQADSNNKENAQKVSDAAYIENERVLSEAFKAAMMGFPRGAVVILDNAPRRRECLDFLTGGPAPINLVGYVELHVDESNIDTLVQRLVKRSRENEGDDVIATRRVKTVYYGINKPRVDATRAHLCQHMKSCSQRDVRLSLEETEDQVVVTMFRAIAECLVDAFTWHHVMPGGRFAGALILLLGRGMDPDTKDAAGETLLTTACMHGNVDLARTLLDRGANPLFRNSKGLTPLSRAADAGNVELFELLLKTYADEAGYPDVESTLGSTSLHRAVDSGHFRIAVVLIQEGANVNHTDKHGFTPVFWACEKGDFEMVQMLHGKGARLDLVAGDKKLSLLHKVAEKGHLQECNFLLERLGRDELLDLKSAEGMSPLLAAVYNGRTAVAARLLEAGAQLGLTDRNAKTVLHIAVERRDLATLRMLTAHGATLPPDEWKRFVNLEAKASKYAKKWSALHFAVYLPYESQALATLKYLFELMQEGDRDNLFLKRTMNACLCEACKMGYVSVAAFFLDKGVDVNAYGDPANTALYFAAQGGHAPVVRLLLDRQADPRKKKNNGRSAWDQLEFASEEIKRMLLFLELPTF